VRPRSRGSEEQGQAGTRLEREVVEVGGVHEMLMPFRVGPGNPNSDRGSLNMQSGFVHGQRAFRPSLFFLEITP
jgi:hypothetical protein